MRSKSRSNVRRLVAAGHRAAGHRARRLHVALAGLLIAGFGASAGAATDAGSSAAQTNGTELRSRFFPKHINSGMLSEKVRARLEESARARAIEAGENGAAAPAERSAPPPPPAARVQDVIERVDIPANGTALRRVVSFQNDEGVTVLSNRPRDLPTVVRAAPTRIESEPEELAAAPAQQEPVTEARRLRPKASVARSARDPEPRAVWPWLALGGTAFAGLGVWWLLRRSVSGS